MKKVNVILAILVMFSVVQCHSQNSEIENIEKVISIFSKAGDANNSTELATCLDDNYRIIMNRLFGSESVSVLDKTSFLKKIDSKEYGGDNRKLTIENIMINGTTACAKVIFKGTKMTFVSILVLLKDDKGYWKIVSDIPIVAYNKLA